MLFFTANSAYRAVALGDKIGLGKTITIVLYIILNYCLKYSKSCVPLLTTPLYPRPALQLDISNPAIYNVLYRLKAKTSAAFIIATPNSVDVQLKAQVQLLSNSTIFKQALPKQKPKIVILHSRAKALIKKYSSAKQGLYYKLTKDKQNKLALAPNQNSKIVCPQYQYNCYSAEDYQTSNQLNTKTNPQTSATIKAPSPTSTRFVIITTLLLQQNRVYCYQDKERDANKAYNRLKDKLITCLRQPQDYLKLLKAKQAVRGFQARFCNAPRRQGDSNYLFQLIRRKRIIVRGSFIVVQIVLEQHFASSIIINKIYKRCSKNTLTYSKIFRPFLRANLPYSN